MSKRSERILKAIEESGLSYGELSRLTSIPKSALQRYATGETGKIPTDRIEAIANATNIPVTYLIGWDDTNSKSDASYMQGVEEAKLIKKYSQLSDANKTAVCTLIDNLLSAQSQ